jgi:hypothetical protein
VARWSRRCSRAAQPSPRRRSSGRLGIPSRRPARAPGRHGHLWLVTGRAVRGQHHDGAQGAVLRHPPRRNPPVGVRVVLLPHDDRIAVVVARDLGPGRGRAKLGHAHDRADATAPAEHASLNLVITAGRPEIARLPDEQCVPCRSSATVGESVPDQPGAETNRGALQRPLALLAASRTLTAATAPGSTARITTRLGPPTKEVPERDEVSRLDSTEWPSLAFSITSTGSWFVALNSDDPNGPSGPYGSCCPGCPFARPAANVNGSAGVPSCSSLKLKPQRLLRRSARGTARPPRCAC